MNHYQAVSRPFYVSVAFSSTLRTLYGNFKFRIIGSNIFVLAGLSLVLTASNVECLWGMPLVLIRDVSLWCQVITSKGSFAFGADVNRIWRFIQRTAYFLEARLSLT
ncbi:MAG: hypothetical protein COB30_002175 [Ectothiorhodospiraceae bacterium]|nr:hypothetical protein [Ectothiorhodospiraceae bacterium]